MTQVRRFTALLVLLVLILLSIAMRYPLVEHERHQTDSYFIHTLSSSVAERGYAAWTLHPLSYVGYYPFSYPSGVPFLLAEVSVVTNMNMELSILVSNMFFAVLFCLAAFILSRHFLLRIDIVLLATLFIVTGVRFVDTSYWDASARSPLVVLMILVVAVSLQVSLRSNRFLTAIAVLLGVGCFVMHHMAVLLMVIALGWLLATFQTTYVLPKLALRKRKAAILINCGLLVSVVILSVFFMDFGDRFVTYDPADGAIFRIEPNWLSSILNMSVSYTNQIGFVLVAAALGLPGLLARGRLHKNSLFLLTLVIVYVSLLWNSLYVSMVLGPFVAIIGARWIGAHLSRTKRRTLAMAALTILIVLSVALPPLSSARWNTQTYVSGDSVEMDNQLFADSTYMDVTCAGWPAIANTNAKTLHLSATTSVVFLGSGLYLALSGDLSPEEVAENLTWSRAKFPMNLYIWFEHLYDPRVDNYILGMMINGVGYVSPPGGYPPASDYFSQHSKLLIVVDNNWQRNTVTQYSVLPSVLVVQLQEAQWKRYPTGTSEVLTLESYAFYTSEGITLYALSLPR